MRVRMKVSGVLASVMVVLGESSRRDALARKYLPALATLLPAFLVLSVLPPVALGQASCTAPQNAIQAENCLPGNPPSQWYVAGTGSPNIQGFATDISVNAGQTISFKISTNAVSWRINIYRTKLTVSSAATGYQRTDH